MDIIYRVAKGEPLFMLIDLIGHFTRLVLLTIMLHYLLCKNTVLILFQC